MSREQLSEAIYVSIRILQNLAETWDVDLSPPGAKLEVYVIRVIHFSRIAPGVCPDFNNRVDFFGSVFTEFETSKNCTMRIPPAAEFGDLAQHHTLP